MAFPLPRPDHMARGDLQGAVLEAAVLLAGPRDGQAADDYCLKAVLPVVTETSPVPAFPPPLLRDSGTIWHR